MTRKPSAMGRTKQAPRMKWGRRQEEGYRDKCVSLCLGPEDPHLQVPDSKDLGSHLIPGLIFTAPMGHVARTRVRTDSSAAISTSPRTMSQIQPRETKPGKKLEGVGQ